MLVVEVGMKLDKDLSYYQNMLTKKGLTLLFSCITRDVYLTKENLDGMTENQMKNACKRFRYVSAINEKSKKDKKLLKEQKKLLKQGYKIAFDTIKFDFQYGNDKMKSRVQLQSIKDVGLLVYYDNPDYYEFPLKKQRKLLLEELNSYGFTFKTTDLGLDKLRTLYYQKEMFSENQNG